MEKYFAQRRPLRLKRYVLLIFTCLIVLVSHYQIYSFLLTKYLGKIGFFKDTKEKVGVEGQSNKHKLCKSRSGGTVGKEGL